MEASCKLGGRQTSSLLHSAFICSTKSQSANLITKFNLLLLLHRELFDAVLLEDYDASTKTLVPIQPLQRKDLIHFIARQVSDYSSVWNNWQLQEQALEIL